MEAFRKKGDGAVHARINTRELTHIALGTTLIAVCSWISVPSLLPAMVPFTMQTFAVCLVSALLGLRDGLWSVGCYILLGIAGAPVFSGFRGGFAVILGTTGGYIAGFLFTALIVGLAVDRFGRTRPVLLLSMALGILVCYAFGTAWFLLVYARSSGAVGLMSVLSWCVAPYLLPDAAKIVLAAFLAKRLERTLQRGVST